MTPLDGKIAIITGAKGGLGNYVTSAFLGAGAQVAGVSRSIRSSDFPQPGFTAFPAELSSSDAAVSLTAAVFEKFGRIDILVHLLGGFAGGQRIEETDEATIDRMLDLNFRSAFRMVSAVLPQMRKQGLGRILAIGSRAAVEPQSTLGAYSASKAALVSFIRTVALENRERCISANVILPGTMDTPANRAADPNADFSKWVQPIQVANLLVHLASDAAAQVTGAVIPVYGGEL